MTHHCLICARGLDETGAYAIHENGGVCSESCHNYLVGPRPEPVYFTPEENLRLRLAQERVKLRTGFILYASQSSLNRLFPEIDDDRLLVKLVDAIPSERVQEKKPTCETCVLWKYFQPNTGSAPMGSCSRLSAKAELYSHSPIWVIPPDSQYALPLHETKTRADFYCNQWVGRKDV